MSIKINHANISHWLNISMINADVSNQNWIYCIFLVTEVKNHLFGWKDHMDFVRKLLTLLNSYTPPEIRQCSIGKLFASIDWQTKQIKKLLTT